MNQIEILDAASEYASEIKTSHDYIRIIELKEFIDTNLKKEIKEFRDAEEKYNEAKKFGKYHPSLKEYQINFSEKKKALYENPYVSEYKECETKIKERLDLFFNSLSNAISNKF